MKMQRKTTMTSILSTANNVCNNHSCYGYEAEEEEGRNKSKMMKMQRKTMMTSILSTANNVCNNHSCYGYEAEEEEGRNKSKIMKMQRKTMMTSILSTANNVCNNHSSCSFKKCRSGEKIKEDGKKSYQGVKCGKTILRQSNAKRKRVQALKQSSISMVKLRSKNGAFKAPHPYMDDSYKAPTCIAKTCVNLPKDVEALKFQNPKIQLPKKGGRNLSEIRTSHKWRNKHPQQLLKFFLVKRNVIWKIYLTDPNTIKQAASEGTESKRLLPGMVEEIGKGAEKYWHRRYSLFSRFDEGVKMDEEGLFSVTPEAIARQQAERCRSYCRSSSCVVVDAFTGVGGNAIQFALVNMQVIAIDINPKRIEYAKHNAKVYGVADRIKFIVGDFFQLAPTLKADVIFLSPPWGGPDYNKAEKYDIQTMLQPKDGFSLFKTALRIAPTVALFLPRKVDRNQLHQLSCSSSLLFHDVEENYVENEVIAVTAYYGKNKSLSCGGASDFGGLDGF